MPLYEYQCVVCDSTKEVQHKIAEKPEVKCKKCGTPMRKCIVGNMTIKFKGKWFSNDGEY
jgi:putative FmdB family regulatory protein